MNVYTNIFLSIVSMLFFSACNNKNTAKEENLNLNSYLRDTSSGVKTGTTGLPNLK